MAKSARWSAELPVMVQIENFDFVRADISVSDLLRYSPSDDKFPEEIQLMRLSSAFWDIKGRFRWFAYCNEKCF